MEKTIREESSDIPVIMECDVAVVGGGPAGMAAAIGASRAGAKTVIVEQYGCLGGNITISSVECPSWYRQDKTSMPQGVQKEIEEKMIALNATKKVAFRPSIGLSYDTELFKYMADCYMKENNITPIYHCLGTVPYMVGKDVKGVITESKSGRCAILAKRVIDCTGDADLVYRSGSPCRKGEPDNEKKLQGGTLKFFLNNVDIDEVEKMMDEDPGSRDPYIHKLLYEPFKNAEKAGEERLKDSLNTMFYTTIEPDEMNVNLATYDHEVDGTDVFSLTNSEIKLRAVVLEVIRRLNKYGGKAFKNAKLRNYAMAVGLRETRRIEGEYTLTTKDIYERRRFDDTIGIFPVYADGEGVKEIPYSDAYFQVPFRILKPTGVNNLLAAGRCISCERSSVPTTRQMDFCMVTGQAAGAASALSIRQNVNSGDVNIAELQEELVRQGLRVF